MNYAGEVFPDGLPVDSPIAIKFGEAIKPLRTLAIVGSHPTGLEGVPWDDPNVDIWLFNEAPLKTVKYHRYDAVLQIHLPEVYTAPNNWVNPNYWPWLQEKRGKPIYMVEIDSRIPDSVKYPLEEILDMIYPFRYLRSSPAMALALGIYQGYQRIMLFGSELSSNTEYAYQATNYAFWIGFAKGRGIDLDLRCWLNEFNQRIYGYEGELQIDKEYFIARHAGFETVWKNNDRCQKRTQEKLNQAMLDGKFDSVASLSLQLENEATANGEVFGLLSEAKRYSEREDKISRQEYEKTAAQAQKDCDELRSRKDHAGGKVEYVWNAWKLTGKYQALEQLRIFLKEKTDFAYEAGLKYGIFQENIEYMKEYDKRLQTAGGVRALGKPEEYQGEGMTAR